MNARHLSIAALPGFAAALLLSAASVPALAQGVTFDRLLKPDNEPQNWLTYHRSYNGWRFSPLNEITRDNVKDLKLAFAVSLAPPQGSPRWAYSGLTGTPIVADGRMYVTDGWSRVYKIDVRSGKRGSIEWVVDPAPDKNAAGEPPNNKGVALLGDTVYSLAFDGRFIGINAATGDTLWEKQIRKDPREVFTMAPLALKNTVVMASSSGDSGDRHWIEARNPATGEAMWVTFTIPAPGEPGNETWKDDKNNWQNGGGAAWNTGTFDPDLNLTFWGTGNPFPAYDPAARPGDNLYTNSVLGLNADTGKISWYFQYTPNESWDYDEIGSHVLVDVQVGGQTRKLVTHFGRNGIYYGLDRTNGAFVNGGAYVDKVTWTKGIDPKTGKPLEYDPGKTVQTYIPAVRPTGDNGQRVEVCPQLQGGTNYFPVTYNPQTRRLTAVAIEGCAIFGANNRMTMQPSMRGSVVSVDPAAGNVVKKRSTPFMQYGGAFSTAGGLVMSGQIDGTLEAMNSETLEPLWSINVGAGINAPPMSYAVNGKQYIAIEVGGGAVPGVFFNYIGRGADPDVAKNQQPTAMLYVFTR